MHAQPPTFVAHPCATQEALDACFRLAWALVHSPARAHIARGIEIAEAMSDHPGGLDARDIIYLVRGGRGQSCAAVWGWGG